MISRFSVSSQDLSRAVLAGFGAPSSPFPSFSWEAPASRPLTVGRPRRPATRAKSAPRGHVNLKSPPSESDRSEIQVDKCDKPPRSRPFGLGGEMTATGLCRRSKNGGSELFFVKERHGLLFKRRGVARLGKGPRYNGAGAPVVPPSPFTI